MYQSGKHRLVVVARERKGRILSFVSKTEEAPVATLAVRIAHDSTIHADEAAGWNRLHLRFLN